MSAPELLRAGDDDVALVIWFAFLLGPLLVRVVGKVMQRLSGVAARAKEELEKEAERRGLELPPGAAPRADRGSAAPPAGRPRRARRAAPDARLEREARRRREAGLPANEDVLRTSTAAPQRAELPSAAELRTAPEPRVAELPSGALDLPSGGELAPELGDLIQAFEGAERPAAPEAAVVAAAASGPRAARRALGPAEGAAVGASGVPLYRRPPSWRDALIWSEVLRPPLSLRPWEDTERPGGPA